MEKRLKDFFIVGIILVLLVYSVLFTGILRSVREERTVLFAPPNNPPGECSDSDLSEYPFIKGVVESDNRNYERVLTKEDYCYNRMVSVEYACSQSYTFQALSYNCPYGCSDGECFLDHANYFLRADVFSNETGNFTNIYMFEDFDWRLKCNGLELNDICYFNQPIGLEVTGIANSSSETWVRFRARGNASIASNFLGVTDDLQARFDMGSFYSPSGTLPSSSIKMNIINKDLVIIQNLTFYVQDGEIIIDRTESIRDNNFGFTIAGNQVLLGATLKEGGVIELPFLYSNGSDFIYLGDEEGRLLAGSTSNSLVYNISKGDEWFFFSSVWGGTDVLLCEENVIANVSKCLPGEKREIYYISDGNCGTSLPGNISYDRCDYDSNGVIGLLSDINSSFDVSLHDASGEVNISRDFNGTRNLTFNEGGDVRIEFEFDFDTEELDLTVLEIIKQNDTDDFGYLIVNGLDVEKSVFVDRIMNESNAVCVRDRVTDEADDISPGCTGSSEYAVFCDGSLHGDYSCAEEGGDYRVSGISNSGVREFESIAGNTTSCTPSWGCTAWAECSSGLQTRSCSDANSCGTNAGKPVETQTCNIQVQSKSCSERGGEICSGDKTCSVGTTSSSDGECCLGVCQSPKGDSEAYFWLVVGILTLAIVVIIVIIFLSLKNKSMQKGLGEFEVSS